MQTTLRRLCHWAAWVTGSVVVLMSSLLIGDGILELGRARQEAQIVELIEARTVTDASASNLLAAETEKQTARSLDRDRRNRGLGWVLLLSVIAFLSSAKGVQALNGQGQPALVAIGGGRSASRHTAPKRERARLPQPTAECSVDLEWVERAIDRTGQSREATIPILQALQNQFRYLPEEALRHVCDQTEIGPSQIIGVASFYAQFRRQPVGRNLVRVCHGTACHVAGIDPIMDELRRRLEIPADGDTDEMRRFTLESVNCLGCCSLAPVMMVEDQVAGRLTPTSAWQELESAEIEG